MIITNVWCWLVSYCLQNILAFVALQRLDAATFSVVNQLKILTSALFARLVITLSHNSYNAQYDACHRCWVANQVGVDGVHWYVMARFLPKQHVIDYMVRIDTIIAGCIIGATRSMSTGNLFALLTQPWSFIWSRHA